MKIGIFGSENSILGFKAIGIGAFVLKTFKEAKEKVLKIAQSKEYAILFITEDWAKKLHQEMDELSSQTLPAIITLPSAQGATKEGTRNLKRIVERAVGSDILT